MDSIENKPNEMQNLPRSPFVTIESDQAQKIQLDLPPKKQRLKKEPLATDAVAKASQLFITAALIMAGCGILLKLFGATSSSTEFDGFRSATIMLILGLIASCENSNRVVGRFGYHLGLTAAVIFGLNFLRLGYKWFEPDLWWRLTPLLAVTMGCSALFAFYKVCRIRRDRSGSLFAIGCAVIAAVLALRFNSGQGLSAIDPSYSITIFCLLIPAAIFRFRDSLTSFIREKVELAPMVIAALLIIAGGLKFSSNFMPQGATANVIETLLGEEDPALNENKVEEDQAPKQEQELEQTIEQ